METKNRFFLLMLLSALFIGFTSCGSDDEDTDYAKEIAGKYIGTLTMEGMPIAQDVEITVTRNSNTKATLKINQELAILPGMPLNIECPSDVTFKDNEYSVTGKTTWMLIAPITVNGTISSGGQANINILISIPNTAGEMAGDFNVVFDGTKK